jgi:hypothetical protein
MSQDFAKVLVKDDRLMVTDSVKYAVVKGGSNMTCARFNAIGSGPFSSVINFNVQVPSQETVISRNALLRATLEFNIAAQTTAVATYTGPGAGFIFNYGGVDGFGPFPFHQLVNSVQWTINNNTVSQNTRDILSILCRIHDKRQLARYNGMTPTLPDSYQSYADATAANNNPFAGFTQMGYDEDLIPRGAFPCTIVPAATAGGANYQAAANAITNINVQLRITEPVLVSPWTFAGDDSQGMYGIQNLNAVYNLSSGNTASCLRFGITSTGVGAAFRYVSAPVVTFVGATDVQLLFQFLTPHPSDLLPSRNVLPYYELPRYLSTNVPSFASGTPAAPSSTVTISSASIQLNQIPDKLYITVGLPIGSRTYDQADFFLPIQKISINWNNSSGLLSSATQQDLWRMSVENGINQNWLEFSGIAQANTTSTTTPQIATCGSVLCLEYGKDIELKDDYYAPGSLGNFQLQFQVDCVNTTGAAISAGAYQLLVITQNSGVFSLERGVASSYLGILTKSDVLEASRQKPEAYSDAIRMVGGGKVGNFFKRLAGTLGRAALKHGPALAEAALKAKMGSGASGGAKRMKDMGGLEDRMY